MTNFTPSPAPNVCYLYLLRHGSTANNAARPPRVQGQGADVPLAPEGVTEAEQAGRWMAGCPLRMVYASPLLRARQTAEAIARPHGLSVETIDAVRECNVGRWEGKTWAEIERDDPENYRLFQLDSAVHPYAGGENISQLLARTAPAIQGLMRAHVGSVIALVAHNVVNRSYLASLIGLPLGKARSIPQETCGINVLRYRDGTVKPLVINALFHLERW